MSEPGDFVPPPQWRSHDFKKVAHDYDQHAGRSYAAAVSQGKSISELIEPNLVTECMYPIVFNVDETSSMDGWESVIIGKYPNLEREALDYFHNDFEVSLAAFGDAYNREDYPVQIRPFTKGPDLIKRGKELIMEHKGGGQVMETSGLIALYYARKVSMPNAITPIHITITDEMPWPFVDPKHTEKYLGIALQKPLSMEEVFAELKRKWATYVVLKPYENTGDNTMTDLNRKIFTRWVDLVGLDHVALLADAQGVVDTVLGIFAKEQGRVPYYYKELKQRQRPEQVERATQSLKTIHALPAPEDPGQKKGSNGKSIMHPPRKK